MKEIKNISSENYYFITDLKEFLDVWADEERTTLANFAHVTLKNWVGIEVGEVKSA